MGDDGTGKVKKRGLSYAQIKALIRKIGPLPRNMTDPLPLTYWTAAAGLGRGAFPRLRLFVAWQRMDRNPQHLQSKTLEEKIAHTLSIPWPGKSVRKWTGLRNASLDTRGDLAARFKTWKSHNGNIVAAFCRAHGLAQSHTRIARQPLWPGWPEVRKPRILWLTDGQATYCLELADMSNYVGDKDYHFGGFPLPIP